ncbi:sugar phosphate isomerase/epimerase [Lacrimispora sp. NSJ-141]|uniref:Sugar phosphate isomerase/epimerase n=1 Tax=Lientehia hominis TaxID=2897778 RepID=A0AAP2RIC7_9FIRM|nr:sugar phosphate isomerase/epimerase family protein [Lientehia hominis]MCD2492170.1 sugar phosphate isomerase/epimerase [Lientehia hominis]
MSLKKSQIVLTNYPYHKCSLRYTLDSMQRLGAEKIEFVCCEPHFYFDDVKEGEPEALKKMLVERGLWMACLTAPTMEYPMNLASANFTVRKKTIDYLVRAIQYAEFFGAPLVSFDAGSCPLDGDEEAAWHRSTEALAYLTEAAESYGRKIAVSVNSSRTASLLCTIEKAERLAQTIQSGSLGFTADTVHLSKLGSSPKEMIEKLGANKVLMAHIADCRGSSVHLAPGEGCLDLKEMLASFDSAGYTGILSLNMRGNRDGYVYEEEPERCMGAGAEWLRGCLI